MSLIDHDDFIISDNPIDRIEEVANGNDWTYERANDDEITISVDGRWSSYHVAFTHMDEFESLHIAVAFDLKVTEPRTTEIVRLLALVNERMWMGHFDLWSKEGVVIFRHTQLLPSDETPAPSQVHALLTHAVETCDMHYQAFQFVVWAGKSAKESLDSVLFETAGEA
ncbi:MAG: YbjN domain-containing protein [Pseudomonadota bacterium]